MASAAVIALDPERVGKVLDAVTHTRASNQLDDLGRIAAIRSGERRGLLVQLVAARRESISHRLADSNVEQVDASQLIECAASLGFCDREMARDSIGIPPAT